MKDYIVSWDIAKQNDATVIQVWRIVPEVLGREDNQRMYTFWQCERLIKWEQLPYTIQVERIANILGSAELKNNHILLMDGTGVGQAVADLVRSYGLDPVEIVFSGGIKPQPLYAGGTDKRFGSGMELAITRGWSVPKVDLIAAAKTIAEEHRILPIGEIPYANEFEKELVHFQGKVNEKGHMTYGNDNEAKHDDFVAAFLMFCWYVKKHLDKDQSIEKKVNKAKKTYTWNPLGDYNF